MGSISNLLSQTAEYALRAVVGLTSHSPTPLSVQRLAKITKIPTSYLSKILQTLRRQGIILSKHGAKGGYIMLVDPNNCSLLDIINAVDPIEVSTNCPLDDPDHNNLALCPLHKATHAVTQDLIKQFEKINIQSLVANKNKRHCSFPKKIS